MFIGHFFRQFWTLLDTLDTFGLFGTVRHFGHFRVGHKLFIARIFVWYLDCVCFCFVFLCNFVIVFLGQFYESLGKVLNADVVKDGEEVTWPQFVEYLLKTKPEDDVSCF